MEAVARSPNHIDNPTHVHANTGAHANERERLEIWGRYLARPPMANDRLSELPDGGLALQLKQRWRNADGRGEAAWGRVGTPKQPKGALPMSCSRRTG